ncbi:hypothetical protein SAMD00019534_109010, partial [Acytostelium subglobosum LB1]|uniref:hypothetical protein n=1 Tax=Acytostelium subglobosum LB1 TaxID=1410327 RepID=UPI000644B1BC
CVSEMTSNILRASAALENQLRRKTYNLSTSMLSEFGGRTGIIPFESSSKDIIGMALVDKTIEPPIRIMSYELQTFDNNYLKHCIDDALQYREAMSKQGKLDIGPKAAYRIINECGDGMPGITVDAYADYLQVITHSEHWCKHLNYITDYIMHQTGKKGVYWRSKIKGPLNLFSKHYKGDKLKRYHPDEPFSLVIEENGMKVGINLEDITSSGLFMDQRANRRYVTSLFDDRDSGSIMNTFSHTATFSLAPVLGAQKISTYSIDNSRIYNTMARKNFELNGVSMNFHQIMEKDVFSKLLDIKDKNLGFDVIIIDPPSVANGLRFGTFTTKNRYRELLEMAMPKLNDGGYIVCFANTRGLREEQWLRQLGIVDYMADLNKTSPADQNNIDDDTFEDEDEIEGNREFAPISKMAKHTSPTLPFQRLNGFKMMQSLEQDVDFRYRVGDERVGKHLKGVVLKHKVDYSASKYKSPPIELDARGNKRKKKGNV